MLSQNQDSKADHEIVLRKGLMLPPVGRAGRSPVFTDALEAKLVRGAWAPPSVGEEVTLPDGSKRAWEEIAAGKDGWFQRRGLGHVYFSVEADAPKVMLLEAAGHNMAYVNGEPRVGDPYAYEYVSLPVMLRQGKNELLFHCSRGRMKARLVSPKSAAFLDSRDSTLPDLREGQKADSWGALVVVNVTAHPMEDLEIAAMVGKGRSVRTPVPALPPFSVRKAGFRIQAPALKGEETAPLQVRLFHQDGSRGRELDSQSLALRVRRTGETYKETFVSGIDGSVQYYAVNPAQPPQEEKTLPALFLSLHGAGVEAIGQADAYAGKRWGYLVAPTNRRPYGFDWEDWGRLDTVEVLNLAQERLKTDPQRVYLTGHSMGGHGAWQVGATFPDRFAAIAPSAGWISFGSYVGGARYENPSPVEAMLQRAASSSDTLALSRNYNHHSIYILHGDADDNVPVMQARTMADHLKAFHRDYTLYEQPGAGHWWDVSDEPGADTVDWLPIFDLFARRSRPTEASIRRVEFVTASPGVSAWCYWTGIEAQARPLRFSRIDLRFDPGKRRFAGTTENVSRLALKLGHVKPGEPLAVQLDGQEVKEIPWPKGDILRLSREGDSWRVSPEPSPLMKGPHRYGPFKEAFRNRMLFVYGTKGTPEENAWAYAKARYDAETFWYRGNGSIDLMADTAFREAATKDRNVILYGNAETNAAWDRLLPQSPVQVRRGSVRIGSREVKREDLACLLLQPRPGSDYALVGAVSGSGLAGMRLTNRLPYFVSGVHYPDVTLMGPEILTRGTPGIVSTGFFGQDWRVESGEFAWSE